MTNNNAKITFLIQFHYSDLHKNFLKNNIFSRFTSISSKNINYVIISSKDDKNLSLKKFSKKYKIPIFFGSKIDLVKRIIQIDKRYQADVYIRILPQWYFLDIQHSISLAMNLHSKKKLFIRLPDRYDFRFLGDIFKIKIIKELDVNIKNKELRFSPFSIIHNSLLYEKYSYKISQNNLPKYNKVDFKKFQKIYDSVWPESWTKSDRPLYSYEFAKKYIKKQSSILDISCGTGDGTTRLAVYDKNKIVGLDIDLLSIKIANKKYKNKNITFLSIDANKKIKEFKNTFDLIVSIHTIEHIKNDKNFISNLFYYAKSQSTLIIEAPLYFHGPYYVSEPYGSAHFREYEVSSLKEAIRSKFKIQKVFGVCRGFIGKKYGNAAIIVAKKF